MMTQADSGPAMRIRLYTKPECELCQVAKTTLLALRCELGFELEEIDITTAPALYEAYREEIPVGYLDGRKLFKYRVDAPQLRRQLKRRRGWLVDRWLSSRRS
jgi:glutaredoxin